MPRQQRPERRIIIDATCPWRIAEELAARGYAEATSPHQLGDAKIKDPQLLRMIQADLEPAILVTYDNKMPVEHHALLEELGTTLAVIDKARVPPYLTREQYWREVIHRHAHRFAQQPEGTRFKYSEAFRKEV